MPRKGRLTPTTNDELTQWFFAEAQKLGCKTQEDVGQLVGLPQPSINKFLHGRIDMRNSHIDTWNRIISVFGYPPPNLNPFNPIKKETKL